MDIPKVFSGFDATFASRTSSMEPQPDSSIIDTQERQQTEEVAVTSNTDEAISGEAQS